MVDTSTFVLTVDGESVPLENVVAAWENVGKLLAAMERVVVGDSYSPGRWHADHDPEIKFAASVNGASKEQLDEIGLKVAQGLIVGSQSGHFPREFGEEAIQAARNVLRLLRKAESLTIYTDKLDEEAKITEAILAGEASLEQITGQTPRRKVYSSIEGVLRRLSVEGKGYTATIKDRFTAAPVEFSVAQDHLEKIKDLLDKDKMVVAEGIVLFDGNVPRRFLGMPDIKERKRNTPLRSFVGVLPPLPEGETAEDFLERLHDASTPD